MSRKSPVLLRGNLPDGVSSDTLTMLEAAKPAKDGVDRKELNFKTSDLTLSEFSALLSAFAKRARQLLDSTSVPQSEATRCQGSALGMAASGT